MIRRREVNEGEVLVHESLEEFLLQSIYSGLHSIQLTPGHYLDLYFKNSGSNHTLTVFHASISQNIHHLPVFSGKKLAKDIGANLISFSDPTLALGDTDLAWFLGNRFSGPLAPILAQVVTHLQNQTTAQRCILFGASGGAHPALLLANEMGNCEVFVVNPRLNLSLPPAADLANYLVIAHRATTRKRKTEALTEYLPRSPQQIFSKEGLPFPLTIFQNYGDKLYLRSQFVPFVRNFQRDQKLRIKVMNVGKRHTAIPPKLLRDQLNNYLEEGWKDFEFGWQYFENIHSEEGRNNYERDYVENSRGNKISSRKWKNFRHLQRRVARFLDKIFTK